MGLSAHHMAALLGKYNSSLELYEITSTILPSLEL